MDNVKQVLDVELFVGEDNVFSVTELNYYKIIILPRITFSFTTEIKIAFRLMFQSNNMFFRVLHRAYIIF